MTKIFKTAALASAAVVAMGIGSANAVMIDGAISFTSQAFTPAGGTDLGDATGVDFDSNAVEAEACSGDLATGGACSAGPGTIEDFDFDPLGELGGGDAGPIEDFWTIGDFDFDLETISISTQDDMSLVLEGTGTMSGVGYDDTPGNFIFTGQTAGGGTYSASFSSASNPTGVAEPATLGLVGFGLVGLGVAARRKSR